MPQREDFSHLYERCSELFQESVRLADHMRFAEAADASGEALDLIQRMRRLDPAHPDLLPQEMALLYNRARFLASDGQVHEGMESAARAVRGYRDLATLDPDRFTPLYADALSRLGQYQRDAGSVPDAIASSARSVEIYRGLVADQPDRYGSDYARILTQHGRLLVNTGRIPRAHEALAEAAGYYRSVLRSLSAAQAPYCAVAFTKLAVILHNQQRYDEALSYAEDAVRVWRRLIEIFPDNLSYQEGLTEALVYHATALAVHRRYRQALTEAEEAISAYARRSHPDTSGRLAAILNLRDQLLQVV
ncbi:tetratricopeptide repeat protein [Marinactinospora thermotolerans]|uniref:Tetratricopeptide repeat-containing protein n=1 Tax=Marinactinospora thermotolerans DSM 45154 TaxID=1122192 RepID=A0A1T4RSD4_9ACTN|nr:tetratricopeptide repeat protein [Marinactinospora thermotolerans]SKA18852.1 Tetratricopeptide repeat-containing protein [Marinactinospora thermotolerans DSM 45154]